MSLQRSRRVWRHVTGLSSPGRRQKIWSWAFSAFSVFIHRNPLKSHKTAKGIFGNPWRKQPEIWKCLEKKCPCRAVLRRPRAGSSFFGGMSGNFYALDASDGHELWGHKIG